MDKKKSGIIYTHRILFLTASECPKNFVKAGTTCYGYSDEKYLSGQGDQACHDLFGTTKVPGSFFCTFQSFSQVKDTLFFTYDL